MKEFPIVPIGTMVTIEAPGGRGDSGLTRVIPAVVLGQWADGSVQLYALHFEGSFLMNSVPLESVRSVPALPAAPAGAALKKFALRDAS